MKSLIIISFVLIVSCQHKVENKLLFVIPEYNKLYKKDSIKYAPNDYYSPNNVIILNKDNRIFYHDNWTSCGTGWKVANPPRAIDFKSFPMKIYSNTAELIETINRTEKAIKQVILISDVDTISNIKYFDLKSKIEQEKNMHVIATRKMTNDEILAIQNNYVTRSKGEKPIDNKR